MRSLGFAGLLLAVFLHPVLADGPGDTPAIDLRVTPVEISGGVLDGLVLHGTVELSADNPDFGGFSGLSVQSGHLIAVSDRGHWLLADLEDRSSGLFPVKAGYAAMRDSAGARLEAGGSDAEGLTLRDGNLVVSFERDHRIAFHLQDGWLGDDFYNPAFERLSNNKGLEALATTPDGWILAIAEKPKSKGFPVFLIRYSGEVDRAWLPSDGRHYVTGADVGPDGRLYVLKRDFSLLLGISILIDRYDLDADGYPQAETRQRLARFDNATGIDNMEGISLWKDARGATRLALISDDNYNGFQRTLLMDFSVLEEN